MIPVIEVLFGDVVWSDLVDMSLADHQAAERVVVDVDARAVAPVAIRRLVREGRICMICEAACPVRMRFYQGKRLICQNLQEMHILCVRLMVGIEGPRVMY